VATEDVLAVDLSVKLLGLITVSGKAADAVGDRETTVNGTLQDAEDARASGGTRDTNVEVAAERLGASLLKRGKTY
jgi:hypothetical protein